MKAGDDEWVRGEGVGMGMSLPVRGSGMLVRIKIGMKLPNKANLSWLILGKNLKISCVL